MPRRMLTSVAVLVATLVNSSVAEQDPQFKKEELEALLRAERALMPPCSHRDLLDSFLAPSSPVLTSQILKRSAMSMTLMKRYSTRGTSRSKCFVLVWTAFARRRSCESTDWSVRLYSLRGAAAVARGGGKHRWAVSGRQTSSVSSVRGSTMWSDVAIVRRPNGPSHPISTREKTRGRSSRRNLV